MRSIVWPVDGECGISDCRKASARMVSLCTGSFEVTKPLCAEHHAMAHDAAARKWTELTACRPV